MLACAPQPLLKHEPYHDAFKQSQADSQAMLILTRTPGESIMIGDDIRVTVFSINGKQIRLGIKAPADVPVHREEIFERVRKEQQAQTQRQSNGNRSW